jgi:hypothetical protein
MSAQDLSELKAHLEKDGARYIPPFLLRFEDGQAVLGHVVRGRVVSSGVLDPAEARQLAAALREYADGAEAARIALLWTLAREDGRG